VGRWPMAAMLRLMPLMARTAKTPKRHKKEPIEDFKQNNLRWQANICTHHVAFDSQRRGAL